MYRNELGLFWFNFRYVWVVAAISVLLTLTMLLRAPLLVVRAVALTEALAIAVGFVLPWLKLRKIRRRAHVSDTS